MRMLDKIPAPLMAWYEKNKRQMPWRDDPTPYHVWISEIMLQQTRVEAARAYYDRFIHALPNICSLAAADENKLLKLWEGLGYYSRVRNLQKAAHIIMEQHNGKLPDTKKELLALPGIGEYTAGAILSIAFGKPSAAVDGNVLRVITRCLADDGNINAIKEKKRLTKIVENILPDKQPGIFNQALMELGATVCLPNGTPKCDICPIACFCKAHARHQETEFPVKPPKKARKAEKRSVWVIEYNGLFYLEQRPDYGLLARMWQFPNNTDTISEQKLTGLSVKETRLLPPHKHIFTHIEWHMTAQHIILNKKPDWSNGVWANKAQTQAEYALPSAFRWVFDYI